ncbi:MAG: endonuclease VII domain-containing protein [Jiangellaceae bacterium]
MANGNDMTVDEQTCKGPCGRSLPATREHFYFNPRSKTSLRKTCIRCHNEDVKARHRANAKEYAAYQQQWRRDNPRQARDHKLRSRYGIGVDEYEQMLRDQGGGCAICGSEDSKSNREHLYVDHCHETGRVRGLLCYHCNTTLGYMRDDPDTLRAAIAYLENHRD